MTRFDPEKSLFELPAVKGIFYLFSAAALITAAIIAINTPFTLCFSGGCFDAGVQIFKVPLGILAVGLTLIGICGANHRSEQTREQIQRTGDQIELAGNQIKATRGQNNFANYYKHLEEFSKLCEMAEKNNNYKVRRRARLHEFMFPKAKEGEFDLSPRIVELLDSQAAAFVVTVRESGDELQRPYKLKSLMDQEEFLTRFLHIVPDGRSGELIYADGNSITIVDNNLRNHIRFHQSLFRLLNDLCHFGSGYNQSESVESALTIFLTAIPTERERILSGNFYMHNPSGAPA